MTATDVSLVIPCHDERRWPYLVAAVRSALSQSHRPTEIVIAVDHNERLRQRVANEISGVTVVSNRFARGVSGTRNTGAFHTTAPIIAFLDDDTVAYDEWLANLILPFADATVVGTGGAIRPMWSDRPGWVPEEFLWAYGASYAGMPTTRSVVRNVWSASMAVRRDVFGAVGGFRVGFGKVGARSRPEDTELCLRMASGGGHWVYVPDAVIGHRVERDRTSLRYFLTRCYQEGRGKIEMARVCQQPGNLTAEHDYLRRTVPRAVARGFAAALVGRDDWGAARAGAILAGVAAAGAGALAESTLGRRANGATPATPITARAGDAL